MAAYYNEIEPAAAAWLRELIKAGHIAPGEVDERSIVDVRFSDLAGFDQCHFFAGIGGWSYAARLAGWPDERPLWTGSCPCQGESGAGKRLGRDDPRHLWPAWFPLINACRPAVVMGEQVARAAGTHWLDGVYSDLESIGYATRAAIIPACAVDAPHRRNRLWFVADAPHSGCREKRQDGGRFDAGNSPKRQPAGLDAGGSSLGDADETRRQELRHGSLGVGESGKIKAGAGAAGTGSRSHWADSTVTAGRRIEPGIRLLAHGVPARVGKLRAYGNAIVPQVAAEVIGAYLEARAA